MRLGLDGFGYVEGATLQEAGHELVRRMMVIAMAFRAGGIGGLSSECPLDQDSLALIWTLGETAAQGGDVRAVLFTPPD